MSILSKEKFKKFIIKKTALIAEYSPLCIVTIVYVLYWLLGSSHIMGSVQMQLIQFTALQPISVNHSGLPAPQQERKTGFAFRFHDCLWNKSSSGNAQAIGKQFEFKFVSRTLSASLKISILATFISFANKALILAQQQ